MGKPAREKRDREREAKRVARRAARQQGCVCGLEITVEWVEEFPLCQLFHDDWCPLLRVMEEGAGAPEGRTQVVLYKPGPA